MSKVKIHESWKIFLEDEFSKKYMEDLRAFLKQEIETGRKIFPPMKKVFNELSVNSPVSERQWFVDLLTHNVSSGNL